MIIFGIPVGVWCINVSAVSSFIFHNVHVSTVFAIHLCRTGVLSWKKFFHLKGKVNLISLLLTGINLETECSYGMVSFGYVMLVTCVFVVTYSPLRQ